MMECKRKKRFAQQLIEFLLVAPFIMIILGIMTEYAYALYVRMVVNEGLREATTTIYKDIKPKQDIPVISTTVLDRLEAYLTENNIATDYTGKDAGPALSLEMVTIGETTVFVATYKYIPAITFPQVYFHFLPEKLNFTLISAVPTTFLDKNDGFDKSITSAVLDGAWGAGAFGNLSDFDASKIGVLSTVPGKNPGQSEMVFLLPVTGLPVGGNNYAIAGWDGAVFSGGQYIYPIANLDDGNIYIFRYTPSKYVKTKEEVLANPLADPPILHQDAVWEWTDPYWTRDTNPNASVKTALSGFSSVVFVHGSGVPLNASGGSISTSNWTTVRAKAVAIVDDLGNSLGNYDKLGTMTYQVDATGGKVIVYNPSLDNVNIIK